MVSRERLRVLAASTMFQEDALEKVLLLEAILEDISRHPLLSHTLALKGGGALNLCFGPPPRLSVDVDFNYVGALDREKMLEERREIERALEIVVKGQGFKAQWSRKAHAGRKCFLGYQSALGPPDRIEVDLNYLHRQILLPLEYQRLWNPDAGDGPRIRVLSMAELCAGKICALLDRTAPRDLYDVGRLPVLAGEAWNSGMFRAVVIGLSGMLPRPIHGYGPDGLDEIRDDAVQKTLYPMLMSGHRPTTEDLKKTAWEAVAPFTRLSRLERQYVDQLQEGTLSPEKLFPENEEMAERLRTHPVLTWKARNAREHHRNKSRFPGT